MDWWRNYQDARRLREAKLAMADEVFQSLLRVGGSECDLANIQNPEAKHMITAALYFMGGRAVQILDPFTLEERISSSSPYRLFRLLRIGTFPLPVIRFLIMGKGLLLCGTKDMLEFSQTVPVRSGEASVLAPDGIVPWKNGPADKPLFTTLHKRDKREWIQGTHIASVDEEHRPLLESWWLFLVRVPR